MSSYTCAIPNPNSHVHIDAHAFDILLTHSILLIVILTDGSAQEELIKRALDVSGIKPNDVDYIEAHGTGTPLGDPIEIEALAEVFARSRPESQPLMIGSVKSNIGHLVSFCSLMLLLLVCLLYS